MLFLTELRLECRPGGRHDAAGPHRYLAVCGPHSWHTTGNSCRGCAVYGSFVTVPLDSRFGGSTVSFRMHRLAVIW